MEIEEEGYSWWEGVNNGTPKSGAMESVSRHNSKERIHMETDCVEPLYGLVPTEGL